MDAVWIERFDETQNECFSVGIKDNIDIVGYRTTIGTQALSDQQPATADAEVISRIKDADIVISGKTSLHELAFGMTGVNHYFGTPVNPKFSELIVGGSSSGSAVAVANNEVRGAIGTDTGGSVRVPAACCGVIGFKPTFGRVSRKGVYPESSSLDCVGTFARTMTDLIRLHSVIDPLFMPSSVPTKLEDLSCALFVEQSHTSISKQVIKYMGELSASLTKVQIPLFEDAFKAGMTIIAYETYQAFGHLLHSPSIGTDIRERLKLASNITAEEIEYANTVRRCFSEQIDVILKSHPLIITPALPDTPLLARDALDGKQDLKISYFARPFNLSGHPAIVLPINNQGTTPVSLQLICAKERDAWLCEIAKQITGDEIVL